MIVNVPFPSGVGSFWQQTTALDGTDYILRFEWNSRDVSWYLAIADVDDVPVWGPQKMVPEWRLLRRCVDPRKPPGELFLTDTTGAGAPAGFLDLGVRHLLVYVEAADVT